jgi:hypothetical protein
MRSTLGICFGYKYIYIVENKNKKVINSLQLESVSGGELEEKVPDELKLVALLKNELRQANIETKDAVLTLAGSELIIRSFDVGILPREELVTAVNFEAKKYIPFKTEDLISDFQVKVDKKNKRSLVLFFSIKKEILDKYTSAMQQLGLNLINIEYSAFSLLRLLDLVGVKKAGTFGIVNIDVAEETNFTVLDQGFPLFSRDINLALELEAEMPLPGSAEPAAFWDKLKNEIRISLDYYRRKFPLQEIKTLIVIANPAYKSDVEAMTGELGLPVEFIDITKHIASQLMKFSLGAAKAYCASLASAIKTPVRFNLLSSKEKSRESRAAEAVLEAAAVPVRVDFRIVALSLIIIFASFLFGLMRVSPAQQELKDIIKDRVKLSTIKGDKSYEEFKSAFSGYSEKLSALDSIFKKQIYLTEELSIIVSALTEGTWLQDLTFRQDTLKGAELVLEGVSFLGDRDKEFAAVNQIFSNLKNNSSFAKTFKMIDITSLTRAQSEEWEVTSFVITCKAEK